MGLCPPLSSWLGSVQPREGLLPLDTTFSRPSTVQPTRRLEGLGVPGAIAKGYVHMQSQVGSQSWDPAGFSRSRQGADDGLAKEAEGRSQLGSGAHSVNRVLPSPPNRVLRIKFPAFVP